MKNVERNVTRVKFSQPDGLWVTTVAPETLRGRALSGAEGTCRPSLFCHLRWYTHLLVPHRRWMSPRHLESQGVQNRTYNLPPKPMSCPIFPHFDKWHSNHVGPNSASPLISCFHLPTTMPSAIPVGSVTKTCSPHFYCLHLDLCDISPEISAPASKLGSLLALRSPTNTFFLFIF